MKKIFLVFFCIAFALTGCERRELTYSLDAPTDAEVDIRVDWSRSGLSGSEADYGATAVFFLADGANGAEANGKTILLGDRNGGKVRLSPGRYRVVVFNRSFDDFGGIDFRGTGCDDFEAYASQRRAQIDSEEESAGGILKESTRTGDKLIEYILPPESLASGYEPLFEVTQEMLDNDLRYRMHGSRATGDVRPVLRLTPRLLTEQIRMNVRVCGLNNVRSASCRISGVSEAVNMITGEPSGDTLSCGFDLTAKTFDTGSTTDGVMTATFNVFGFDPEVPHELDFTARLVDGKTVFRQHFDRVDIRRDTDAEGNSILSVHVSSGKVPDVKPDGSKENGFGADVNDWGDDEQNGIII